MLGKQTVHTSTNESADATGRRPGIVRDIVLLIGGLILLVMGAESVLRGSSRLALSLGVAPLLLGLTVVSIGTSAPELAIGITSSLQGSGSLAVGNITGTNVVNILLILGVSATLRPLALNLRLLKLELPVIVGATLLLLVAALDGVLTQLEGMVMLGCAVVYTVALVKLSSGESDAVRSEFEEMYLEEGTDASEAIAEDMGKDLSRHRRDEAEQRGAFSLSSAFSLLPHRVQFSLMIVFGLTLTVMGANLLVTGAAELARDLGVSEAIIGLTIVAIGTSAPELATTIVATIKDERDVAVGNLLGSSIYNVLLILAIICIVSPGGIPIEHELVAVDIPVMVGAMLMCIPVFITGRRVSRLEGAAFVGFYLIYLAWLIGRI